jgi:AcrR family transcriptional regulator
MSTTTDTAKPNSKYERRREAIMQAAAAVFAEKGFHGASTQDIADRLEMKQGSLYYYFASKEAALEAVCLFGAGESLVRLRQIIAADATLPEKIAQVVHSQLYGLKTRCDARLVFVQQRRLLPPEPRERIRALGREYRALLACLLREAQRHGEVDAGIDPELAARALIGLCDSVAPWFRQDSSLDIDTIAEQYTRLFCAGIQPARA